MIEIIKNLPTQIEQLAQKYYPLYMEWLAGKLDSENAFGTLAIVGVISLFILFIYIHAKNSID
ncbi:MAG: hypothetical protein Q7T51_02270 [Candidatus Moranbacteria bacterium]|nr:hypothetical protein [Candidatus Moranbacteria bacterium]